MRHQEKIPYEEVFRALNKEKINYLVCGGAAVVLFIWFSQINGGFGFDR